MIEEARTAATFNDQAFIAYCKEQARNCRPIAEVVAERLQKHRGFIAEIRARGVSWDSILEGLKRGGLSVSRASLIAAWALLEADGENPSSRKSDRTQKKKVAAVAEEVAAGASSPKRKPSPVVLGTPNNSMECELQMDASLAEELESALSAAGSVFEGAADGEETA